MRLLHKTRISPPPMQWDEFQIENLVASSFGGNQFAISRAQGGKPMPWNQPLSIQMMPRVSTAELKPNNTFMMADATRPTARNARELERSARKPFPNFETP